MFLISGIKRGHPIMSAYSIYEFVISSIRYVSIQQCGNKDGVIARFAVTTCNDNLLMSWDGSEKNLWLQLTF